MSEARQQTFIEAPVEVVWDLLADVGNHARWWPRVLSVDCEGYFRDCLRTSLEAMGEAARERAASGA